LHHALGYQSSLRSCPISFDWCDRCELGINGVKPSSDFSRVRISPKEQYERTFLRVSAEQVIMYIESSKRASPRLTDTVEYAQKPQVLDSSIHLVGLLFSCIDDDDSGYVDAEEMQKRVKDDGEADEEEMAKLAHEVLGDCGVEGDHDHAHGDDGDHHNIDDGHVHNPNDHKWIHDIHEKMLNKFVEERQAAIAGSGSLFNIHNDGEYAKLLERLSELRAGDRDLRLRTKYKHDDTESPYHHLLELKSDDISKLVHGRGKHVVSRVGQDIEMCIIREIEIAENSLVAQKIMARHSFEKKDTAPDAEAGATPKKENAETAVKNLVARIEAGSKADALQAHATGGTLGLKKDVLKVDMFGGISSVRDRDQLQELQDRSKQLRAEVDDLRTGTKITRTEYIRQFLVLSKSRQQDGSMSHRCRAKIPMLVLQRKLHRPLRHGLMRRWRFRPLLNYIIQGHDEQLLLHQDYVTLRMRKGTPVCLCCCEVRHL
jgi:hypothetical protein